jgi:hypothetical protein
MEPLVEELLEL